ncbi:MAG TPA: DUF4912 domain-containing protein [Treponemataceae bacterium]|jgi:hypothetical protein|nr:DUF4912 domain-containing protein [Treponemataceae bacterium]HOQ92762.1 DUF4912 domain-containing protein [Treponemataceae bacterium]HUH43769.1 DUF4912 domain-containing protein [Treponemataceae bacterium]
MRNKIITKADLESMSTSALVSLADEYNIEIPESLNRRFIISELLEIAEEQSKTHQDDLRDDASAFTFYEDLPKNFNETYIGAIMRNPLWCFAYWDIRDSEFKEISQNPNYLGLTLSLVFYKDGVEVKKEGIEIEVHLEKKEQFILLNPAYNSFRLHLIAEFSNTEPKIISSTQKITIPHIILEKNEPGIDKKVSPIIALSGMHDILREHYNNHRQTFI